MLQLDHASALVLIDLQGANALHSVAPHSIGDVVRRSAQLIAAARRAGLTIIHVRTSFLPDESDSLSGKLRTDAAKATRPPRPSGWDELLPEVSPRENEPVIVKRSWNAFFGSDLDLQLRRRHISTIILGGISTALGVEGTARAAYDRGYQLVFAPDAMSSYTEKQHEYSVSEIFPHLGEVRKLQEVLEAISDLSRSVVS